MNTKDDQDRSQEPRAPQELTTPPGRPPGAVAGRAFENPP